MCKNIKYLRQVLMLVGLIFSLNVTYGQELYWIGGSGDWNDPAHWSNASGSENQGPAGQIPDENFDVFFDDFSGLTTGEVITISPDQYAVRSFTVTVRRDFTLQFSGVSGNVVEMNILGDLTLTEEMIITYASTSPSHNTWIFTGNGEHNIATMSQDLLSVQFDDIDGEFNQLDDLEASARIRMLAGTWNSAGHDVRTNFALFRDNNSSSNPLPKQFNTGGSDIYAEEWDSRFTYGSLTVSGPHRIFAEVFIGSPKQINGPSFFFDEIILLELPDGSGGIPIIEYNNFECRECIVETIRVRDTGNTKFGGKFTVTEGFVVENPGSVIQFNGGNGRQDEVVLNGTVETPAVSGCDGRTVFTNIHNDFTTVSRDVGALTISNAELNNLQASGGATFNLSNGILLGSSSGWNVINAPNGLDFYWVGDDSPGVADWDNPNHWLVDNDAPNGCLPTILDNVIVPGGARTGMRIAAGFTAECKDFIWDNSNDLELLLDGASGNSSRLVVGGNFSVDNSLIITGVSSHELQFSSAEDNVIETNGVVLPRLNFIGANGLWRLNDDLSCESILFEGGTLGTQGQDIETNEWFTSGSDLKSYLFGSSRIIVNGDFNLESQAGTNLSINAGTSLLECENLDYIGEAPLHDVKMINSSSTSFRNVRPHTFNSLTLGGSGAVTIQNDLTVNELIFEVPRAWLRVRTGDELTVNEAIRSLAPAGDPGRLESRTAGVQVSLNKSGGNLCVDGPVAFQDIEALVDGVLHAPEGVDNGNNTDIVFDDGSGAFDLYWIGGSGDWDVLSNWSQVSGGCPTAKDPSTMDRLFFNDNSFFSAGPEVTVGVEECAELYFLNSEFELTLNVVSALEADLLVLDDAEVEVIGKGLSVNTTTRVDNGGFLRLNLLNYLTGKLESNNGIIRVLAGTNAIVRPQ